MGEFVGELVGAFVGVPIDAAVVVLAVASAEPVHWSSMDEIYPVPSASLIPLPTGKAKDLPTIQHKFGKETTEEHAVEAVHRLAEAAKEEAACRQSGAALA